MSRPTISPRFALTACLLALAATTGGAQEAAVKWRTDYNAAREEAVAKLRPVLIDFYTDACSHCVRMDRFTFSDPKVAGLINERFIPLKINASVDPTLSKHWDITQYPTIVVIGWDRRVLNTLVGFHDAAELTAGLKDMLTKVPLTPQERYKAALKSRAAGEYMHAVSHLREILDDGQAQGLVKNAWELLKSIEKGADDQLKRAKKTHATGKSDAALVAYSDVWRNYPTLPAGREARDRINHMAQHNPKAREVMKQDFIPTITRNEALWGMWPYGSALQSESLGLLLPNGQYMRRPPAAAVKVFDYGKLGR